MAESSLKLQTAFAESGAAASEREADAVKALAALAQAVRLRTFRALVVAGCEGLTPGALALMLGVSPTSLSFHLKELMHARLVSCQRDGRNLIYRASFDHMNALLAYLTEHCCEGQPCESVPLCSTVCN